MAKKQKSKRRWFLSIFKFVIRIFKRKPKFLYLGGEPVEQGSIILSNHVGTSGPLTLELYLDTPFRFWGTYEMNGNLRSVYKYLSFTFYHQKKHWKLFWARLFCIIAAPLTFLFYRGLNLISTYKDMRFRHTLRESLETLKKGHSLVIFPEDSSKGYFDTLTQYFEGFAVLGNLCLKKGLDPLVYNAYLKKKSKTYIFDKPIRFSELIKQYEDKQELSKYMCDRANELSKMI